MRISIDFGITVTDSLKKTSNGSLEHKMVLSNSEPCEDLVRSIFPEINFDKVDIAICFSYLFKISSLTLQFLLCF